MTRANEALARLLTRDRVTSAVELLGAGAVVAGCFVLFGLGVALMVAGVALIGIGYLAGAR